MSISASTSLTVFNSFCLRYYITYHQWNSKPEFIVANHKVINYKEVLNQHDASKVIILKNTLLIKIHPSNFLECKY